MKLRFVNALLAAAILAGCSDSSGPEGPTIAGTYALASIDGAPVPVVTTDNPGFRAEVLGSTLVIRGDGTWTETRQGRVTLSGSASTVDAVSSGTFTASGSQLVLTIPPAGGAGAVTIQGTFAADAIVLTMQSKSFRFVR